MKTRSTSFSTFATPFILLILCCLQVSVLAQNTVLPSGGNVKNANGSLSFSFGQPADALLLSPNMTNEGVQQAYREDSAIWNREVCQGVCYEEAPFNITALQTATPGLLTFRDTLLNANRFGGDSIIVLKLTVHAAPDLNVASFSNPSCGTFTDGSITLAATAGTSPYEYRISSGEFGSTATFPGLSEGTYKFYVRDNNGCIDSVEQPLTDPLAITFTPTATETTLCLGESTTLAAGTVTGGAGGYTYSWSSADDDNGLPTTTNIASLSATPEADGPFTYTLRVTDANNCYIDHSVSVSVNSLPALTITPGAASCNGGDNGSITLLASGGSGSGYQFKLGTGSYDDGTGTNHENYTFPNLTPATDYRVTVKDGNNCEFTSSDIAVSDPPAITFDIMNDTALCAGDAIKIGIDNLTGGTVAGDYTITWTANTASDVANMATTNTDSVVITPTATTTYTATVTDDNSCSESHTLTVTVRELPTLTATPDNNPLPCNGGNTNVTLSAIGGAGSYTYTMDNWTNSQTSTSYSSLIAGNYTFAVRDAKGCVSTKALNITEPEVIAFTIRSTTPAICNGGNATLDTTAKPTGGDGTYTYAWTSDNDAVAGLPVDKTTGAITVNPTATTVYTLTVTDGNGCTHTENITLGVGSNPSLTIASQTNVLCYGNPTGAATLTASGGSGSGYQFQFGTGTFEDGTGVNHDTMTYSGLSAGTTTITVRDADGCTSTKDLTITQPDAALAISSIVPDDATICLGATSTITPTVTGGTTGYTYAWTVTPAATANLSSATATAPSITPTTATTYTVSLTVTDANGCVSTEASTNIVVNELDTIRFLSENICGGNTYNLNGFNTPTTRRIIDQTLRDTNRSTSVLTGCDSTTVLALLVKHADSVNITATVNGGETYNLNGFNVTPARSNTTYIYIPTPTNAGTNVGGCDSITTLTLTVRASDSTQIDTAICDNTPMPFTWRGKDFAAAGTQYKDLTGSNGQDSVLVLNLAIKATSIGDTTANACGQFVWYGNTYNTSSATAATHVFTNAAGCDSTVTLNLTIHPVDTNRINDNICASNIYSSNGFSIATTRRTVPQTLYDTLRLHSINSGSANCDSTVTLTLTVYPVDSINIVDAVNGGTTYNANGFNIATTRSSATTILTPAPTNSATNLNGCDSITTLTLTIRGTDSTRLDTAVCANNYPVTYQGRIFDAAGQQTKNLTNINGGDSVVTLNVTTKATSSFTDVHTACGSFTWIDGNTYTTNNSSATHTVLNSVGCDSIITLNLTVYSVDTTRYLSEEICGGNTFSNYGFNIVAPRRITDQTLHDTLRLHSVLSGAQNCDSTVVVALTVHHVDSVNIVASIKGGSNYNANGFDITPERRTTTYVYTPTPTHNNTNVEGCGSITTLTLTVLATDSVSFDTVVCSNDYPVDFHNVTFVNASQQSNTYVKADGGDSVVTLTVTTKPASTFTDIHTACATYTWIDGNTYTSSNTTATHTITNSLGCDSIITLNLTIYPVDTVRYLSEEICGGNTYTNHGFNIEATRRIVDQTLRDTLRLHSVLSGAQNCDSTVVVALTVHHVDSVNISDQINGGTLYLANGFNVPTERRSTSYVVTPAPTNVGTNVNGCDSITTLTLTVRGADSTRLDTFICDDTPLPYTWKGKTFAAAGTQYSDLLGSNGQDSVLVLTLAVHATSAVDTVANACNSFTWYGNSYSTTNPAAASRTLTNSAGCDSVVTLNLTISNTSTFTDTRNVCDSLRWIDGNLYTADNNTATFTTTNSAGCDSVVTLNLTVKSSSTSTDTHTGVCDSLRWIDGNLYTANNNTATHHLTNVSGCDSLVTLNLTINQSSSYTDVVSSCDSVQWLDGNWYYASTSSVSDTILNNAGCDSVIFLNLTIYNSNTGTDVRTECDSLIWIDGATYYASISTAQHRLIGANAYGCDSLVTLNLTLNNSSTGVDVLTKCDQWTWIDGNTYTFDNNTNATHTLTNALGCDSVVTLNLTLHHSSNITIRDTICFDALPYNFGGETFTSADTKVVNATNVEGCDSTTTLILTVNNVYNVSDAHAICSTELPYSWNGVTFLTGGSQSATLSTINGCDSVVNMTLTVSLPPHSTTLDTACYNYTWTIGDSVYNITQLGTNEFYHHQPLATGCFTYDTLRLTLYGNSGTDGYASGCVRYMWMRTGENFYHDTVVGASYTDANGCISIDTLRLTIFPNTSRVIDTAGCDTFYWDRSDMTYTAGGNYHASYTDINNCPATDTIHLTLFAATHNVFSVNVCNSFDWTADGAYGHGDGQTFTTPGTYASSYVNADGCASTDTLKLFLRYSTSLAFTRSACDSFVWTNNGNIDTFFVSGRYLNSYLGINGCQSVDTLYLTLGHSNAAHDYHVVCDTLLWHDSVYRVSTKSPTYTTTNAEGCDSVTTLDLSIYYSTSSTEVVTRCDSYVWHDSTYTASTRDSVVAYNSGGCDSIVYLSLTIKGTDQYDFYTTVCDSLLWNNRVYRESTSGDQGHFTNSYGCDSVVTLYLTIRKSSSSVVRLQGSNQLVYNGYTYTTSGTYVDTITNSNNCDSVVTLNLAIIHGKPLPVIQAYQKKMVMVDHLPSGNGGLRVEYDDYRWYRNGTLIPGANSDQFSNRNYADLAGSFYVEVPTDVTRQYWVYSNTINFADGAKTSINLDQDFHMVLYPNPTHSGNRVNVTLASDESELVSGSTLKVYDLHGRMVYATDVNGISVSFVADFPTGVYTVVYQVPNRDHTTAKLIIK